MNYKQAFAVGLIAPGVMAVREPVAYLYNGVRLPKLPESELPNAALFVNPTYGTYQLYFTADKYRLQYHFFSLESVANGGGYQQYVIEDGNWTLLNEGAFGSSLASQHSSADYDVAWSNYDVIDYDEDGAVYLSASEPIPVYE